jgi:hypothetical protein
MSLNIAPSARSNRPKQATPILTETLSIATAGLNPMDPIVIAFYTTKKTLTLSVKATFFETNGWTAPQREYDCTFEPIKGWAKRSTGDVMIRFQGEDKQTKCSLKFLMEHGLVIKHDENSDQDSPPHTPKNGKQPAAVDPNRTQTFNNADSSDDDDDPRDEGKRSSPQPPLNPPSHSTHDTRRAHGQLSSLVVAPCCRVASASWS